MSNYTKATDFAAKDSLLTGNPAKIIKGSELNDEFNSIQTAVATKADLASPAFTGSPTAATQATGNNTTRLATTAFVQNALAASVYPVGSIYLSVVSTNPGTLLGFGTWAAFATGRALVGINAANSLMNTVEETFGSADSVVVSHTHAVSDPGHDHAISATGANAGGSGFPGFDGSGNAASTPDIGTATTGISIVASGVTGTNANYQPSIAIYIWKRTA
jgi:hypothetical protein